MTLLAEPVFAELDRLLDGQAPPLLAVAVSGGGDSMAALALACDWARARGGGRVVALTVDHGLRPDSTAEAQWVAARAADLGAGHQTLTWDGWDGQGNLQARARAARYALLSDWARATPGLPPVILGHTRDDQAETFLMRLARGSGVDGLSAMAARHRPDPDGPAFLRPLLGVSRPDLRAWLASAGLAWLEDPSNDDDRFARVRMRKALALLDPLGIDAGRLAATAGQMARARVALDARMAELAARIVTEPLPGLLRIDRAGLGAAEAEIGLRLLAQAMACLTGAAYRPRLSSLEAALAAGLAGEGTTLGGVQILARGAADLLLVREFAAVAGLAAPADGVALWDRRWSVDVPGMVECTIRALGPEGASRIARPAGLPHAALMSYPGVFRDGALLAAPGLWQPGLCSVRRAPAASFRPIHLSH